ncbi:MAG TPA: glycine C-acetyltransferase [Propionibacteriaceae bacterium]|nr:glycine C-acetyltransferase [Propionibacteriaceae bacterium]
MYGFARELATGLAELREAGLYKVEGRLASPQSREITVAGKRVINMCANNYLGLADHPAVVEAARAALQEWGFGMASVRFICGTTELHVELERRLSEFLGTEATILYSSCFDANGGFFEALTDERDAIISDELNHASIIDGVRLSKAARFRYRNRDLDDLATQLSAAAGARRRIVATDGVFSMDGYLAPLPGICDLAEEHDALVMVDDSHAVGFIGGTGAGTPEHLGVRGRVDVVTGTLGKAMGGASGGYVSGPAELVEWLRQRSRPYLFSNSLAPSIVAASLAVLDLLASSGDLRQTLRENTAYFRARLADLGFDVPESDHPIVPVMVGDAAVASRMADELVARGVYVRAFSYPVVPQGKARIRAQLSAAHTRADLDLALDAFVAARDAVR